MEFYKDKCQWDESHWPSLKGFLCGAAAVTVLGVATMALLSKT